MPVSKLLLSHSVPDKLFSCILKPAKLTHCWLL
ncbi:Uncharacterized protein APZ42_024225 [Daphnia magna]|uniref:Uncharacterized protein n=1 Tax=Daphnia magna TaxID=35525 RepID=A0A164UJ64_9CRUS|nr:Uncharacterized protein APZ42_024225 [Daphnia magna]